MLRGYCIHCGFPATNKCNHCGATVCNNCKESHAKKHNDEAESALIAESANPEVSPEPVQSAPVSQAVKAEVKKPGRPRVVK